MNAEEAIEIMEEEAHDLRALLHNWGGCLVDYDETRDELERIEALIHSAYDLLYAAQHADSLAS